MITNTAFDTLAGALNRYGKALHAVGSDNVAETAFAESEDIRRQIHKPPLPRG